MYITASINWRVIPLVVAVLCGLTPLAAAQLLDDYRTRAPLSAPVGTYSHWWQCGQIQAAHDALAIYNCDWIDDSSDLSPFMRRHLISRFGDQSHCVWRIVIEPSETCELDELRRLAIIDFLACNRFRIPCESITIGYATRDRLRGDEASRVLDGFQFPRTGAQPLPASPFSPNFGINAPLGGFGPVTNGTTGIPALDGIFAR